MQAEAGVLVGKADRIGPKVGGPLSLSYFDSRNPQIYRSAPIPRRFFDVDIDIDKQDDIYV